MRAVGSLLLAFLLAFPLVAALPVQGPLPQNDAGSGRDAGPGAAAVAVQPGRPYNGSFVDPTDHEDDYTFAGEAGDAFDLTDLSPGVDCWTLVAPSGATRVLDCYGLGANATLAETGAYTLLVRPLAPSPYQFGFSLTGERVPHDVSLEDDANSGRDAGLGADAVLVQPGIRYEGGFADTNDHEDGYVFAAHAGDTLRFGDVSPGLACWYLTPPSGAEQVLDCTDVGSAATLGETGFYALRVLGFQPYSFGFTLDGSAQPVSSGIEDDAGTGADAPEPLSLALAAAPGVAHEGSMDGSFSDVADAYRLTAADGQVLDARLAAPFACLQLYAPDLGLVDWSCSDLGAASLTRTLTAGAWYLRVDAMRPVLGFAASPAQRYAFSYALDAAAPPVSVPT